MNDYELGTNLRRQLLADQQRGIRHDPRRLQALVGDFCGDRQLALLPALKHLVLTPAFSQALAQSPALPADPHLALHLQQELEAVFAPAISGRTVTALRGLLGLPPTSTSTPAPMAAAARPAAPPQQPPVPAPTPAAARSSGSRGVLALLSFMAGVLVVGVVGALAWLVQLNRPSQPLAAPPSSERPQAQPEQPSAAELPPQELTPPPPPNLEQAELERAISTVQQLYGAVSSRNDDAARRLFGGAAADQFDPNFFRQFSRVSVADLVETGRSGSTVELVGLVTFHYPDGTSQVESRTFSVDTASDPAVITASSFQSVVQPR